MRDRLLRAYKLQHGTDTGSAAVRRRRVPIIIRMVLCAVPFVVIPLFKSFWTLAALAVLLGLGRGVRYHLHRRARRRPVQESLGAVMEVFGTIADVGQVLDR